MRTNSEESPKAINNRAISTACSLPRRHGRMLARLASYDISFVFYRLGRTPRWKACSKTFEAQLELELKKFIALAGFGIFPLAMIGPRIDDVWHQFVLFTSEYRRFCQATVGRFIDHRPDVPSAPVPIAAGENFRSAYREYFGALPAIWYAGMSAEARRYYQQPVLVGKPPMEWSGWTGPEGR